MPNSSRTKKNKRRRTSPAKDDGDGEDGAADLLQFEDAPEPSTQKRAKVDNVQSKSNSDMESDSDDDGHDDLFADAPSVDAPPKQQQSQETAERPELSKFIRRILDPNRRRGLVEPPQVIPLNDEFLQAFGRREKAYDQQIGRETEIDHDIVDDDGDATDNITSNNTEAAPHEVEQDTGPRKIKIANLRYTTTEETLWEACLPYGDVVELNLLKNDNDDSRNIGRAYVTFATAAAAQAAVDQSLGGSVDGRPLRVSIAEEFTKRGGGGGGPGSARYWLDDLSTKCFRCGQVGHMSDNCTNKELLKPCPLCCSTEHEMRACPWGRICFQCGIPGHVNRECTQPRGMPPRAICSVCLGSGHVAAHCRQPSVHSSVLQAAICMTCGQTGHFMCGNMQWFFGLKGVSCYNCGSQHHSRDRCSRPNMNDLARNEAWALQEIERADEYQRADEREAEQQERDRQRQMQRDRYRNRAKSEPHPSRHRDNNSNYPQDDNRHRNSGRGYNTNNNRGYNTNNNSRGGGGGGGGEEFRYTVGGGGGSSRNSNNNSNNNNRRNSSGNRRRGY